MPRRLSDVEYVTFLDEVNIDALSLPPWGGVVEWRGMDVLVFQGPKEVFLTDVSELASEWKSQVRREYDPLQEIWLYRLPEETANVLFERAEQLTRFPDVILDWTPFLMVVGVGWLFFNARR